MNTSGVGGQVINIPIEDIIPNRFQPRLNFEESSLKELASSIKEHGIIQPLILRRLGDKYEIVAGERRYKASKMAGLMSVPAIITAMDDKKSAEVAIVENIQRRDLSAIEEAKSYKALLDKGYLTQEELAKKMGLSQSAISNKLRLLQLSEDVQNALMEGKISERHARSLLQLEDTEEQNKWLKTIIDERITVKELDRRLKEGKVGEKVEEQETPIIELNPDINVIKETATDIIPPAKVEEENIINTNENNNTIIPNKFFNYLEDEKVNMNSLETPSAPELTIEEKTPLNDNNEIELLDFVAPGESIIKIKDMAIAEDLLNNLETNLKNNNYTTNVVKEETDKEVKYIVTINKEE